MVISTMTTNVKNCRTRTRHGTKAEHFNELQVLLSSECFGEYVRRHVLCLFVHKCHCLALNVLTDKVLLDRDMLCYGMKFWVLDKRNASLAFREDSCWCR